MSDVVVSVTESTTTVAVTENSVNVAVTETPVAVSASTAGLQGATGAQGPAGTSYAQGDPIYVLVRNATGATLTQGQLVYTSGANGSHTLVSLAKADSEMTSSRTLGWVSADIANNADGYVQIEGYLDGINTQGITEGSQLYLSGSTAGAFTATKPQAPIHLVYVGVSAKASAGNGRVLVKVQNGYELEELHNVQITSIADKNVIQYDSASSLWKNVAGTALTVGSAVTSGTAYFATIAGTASTISGSITNSQVSDFTSGTVAVATSATSASTATNAGTAYFATTAGTASYATTAGTAVSISGSITKSQVSDFTSGTVTTISGSITRSQVSDYSGGTVAHGTADPFLTGDNAFTGQNTFTPTNASSTALRVVGQPSQGAPLQDWRSSSASLVSIAADGALSLPNASITASGVGILGQIQVTPISSATIGVIVKNAASQSANLQEWQTVGGTTMALISSSGAIRTTGAIAAGSTASIGQLTSVAPAATTLGFVQKGAASQLADLLQLQTSTSVILGGRNAVGQIYTGSTAGLTTSVGGATLTATSAAGTATITTTTAHNIGQGDLVVVAGITPTGFNGTYVVTAVPSSTAISYVNATSGPQTVAGTISVYAQTSIVSRSAATPAMIMQAATSQGSNILEIRTSSGGTALNISSGGLLRANGRVLSTGLQNYNDGSVIATFGASSIQIGTTTSFGGGTGVIGITNASGTPTSNPTGGGILYVESGALKYRGSSGTITTLGSA